MAKIRVFVAVSISDQARNAVVSLIQNFKNISPGIRWIKPENLHLTLKFLGELEEINIPNLKNALDLSVVGLHLFQYGLTKVGCFPSFNRPRVLWVGVEDFSKQLLRLHENIENQFSKVNFPREKRGFKPHLTIARVKSNKNIEPLLSDFKNFNFGPYSINVSDVLLMKSDLQPSGAKYTCLHKTTIN